MIKQKEKKETLVMEKLRKLASSDANLASVELQVGSRIIELATFTKLNGLYLKFESKYHNTHKPLIAIH